MRARSVRDIPLRAQSVISPILLHRSRIFFVLEGGNRSVGASEEPKESALILTLIERFLKYLEND